MTILVTGAAGFIGSAVSTALLARGQTVLGLDNLNDYYDPALKQARLARLGTHRGFSFRQADVADRDTMLSFAEANPDVTHVLHFAAQAGVRRSLIDPYSYVTANVMGHLTVLEAARRLPNLQHLLYASSSSVYGSNSALPFREDERVDAPNSFYAVTKRSAELTSQSYAHLYGIPQTGLRFFTVYGPWGRPDMAYYSFARAIASGTPLTLYSGRRLSRDFTYIDDVVDAVLGVMDAPIDRGQARLLNIGNDRPEPVSKLIQLLEQGLGRAAVVNQGARPDADMEATWASLEAIGALTGWAPKTTLDDGVGAFLAWFRGFHPAG
ncbi:UDP-N-acetylglucosamine 4-epimerase [Ameyamaea chiangmaiensis NBRC 103196]|uniref:NAD-dependent epimerase/dehydratase family protein n=1 Tax=Ameyamaea chiangmaiensis TaxID=442969 RepID=A0A850PBT1_9PROT|nr:NAD-dependent epimerase/dehydratase family protein [Ameyamaea chiangmaiensis]MBS4074996.1 NAD-dependent epimerase/dehydratase family protein [Ameyamaea chiangmaiensis]NVN41554.1 NAD-dependent epimerase/dehydratase family protein [Ameyamaea chiangmaiensis]GBQ66021.1 UDP-N-acetylglucosamine 4-epimerase [Ameyamaea chiangmaiensis NBRC 103196]